MLKSRYNLKGDYEVEGEEVEQNEAVYMEHADEEKAEEEKTEIPVRKLHQSEVSVRLSMLGKTAEGDGYTYLKATCTEMKLTDIKAITYFKHLQFVDVSNNNLDLDALQVLTELPFLVLIHADKNILESAALKRMKYLQVIIMNYNRITSVNDVYQPELSTLEIGYNNIRHVNLENSMPNLRCLDFRNNVIEELGDFNFPNLDSLYLAGNKITSLVGIEKLVNLRILHVRDNPIKLLNGFDPGHAKLQYLNLRNCKVTTLIQIKKLRVLKALDTLILKGCPYMGEGGNANTDATGEEEDDELRVEILASLPRLKRINKGVVTSDERAEAKDLMTQWLEEGENDEEEVEEEQENESNPDE